MGTIIADQTPSADDILKSTNKALEQLTTELDHRIDEMKSYVDNELIRMLKDINHRKYKSSMHIGPDALKVLPLNQSSVKEKLTG